VRLLHTHLRGEQLTQDDLTDLALLRLDLVAAVTMDAEGFPAVVHTAHLVPGSNRSEGDGAVEIGDEKPWSFLEPRHPAQLEDDFLELIENLEAELARTRQARSASDKRERAILVSVTTHSVSDAEESMNEMAELARSAGVVVLDRVIQRRGQLDPRTLVGSGKLKQLLVHAMQLGVDMIIFDRDLTPAQVKAINAATDLKVVDRTQLILDIFAQRAQSREGKIQVELAQLKYMLPRLTGSGAEMSRLAGGIGGRGPGETKLEVDRRRINRRLVKLKGDLADLERTRGIKRSGRLRAGTQQVSLVGYTNAGKSTLLNALTGAGVLVEDRLFSTLDPTARRLELPDGRHAVLIDTVGFVRKLPHQLVEAFRSTLEETKTSDLLLQVVDASDSDIAGQMEAVERVVRDVGANHVPRLVALNKADLLTPALRATLSAAYPQAVFISAATGEGLPELLAIVAERLDEGRTVATFRVPHERGEIRNELHASGEVLEESFAEEGAVMVVRAPASLLHRFADYLDPAPDGA
jgi:GTP-binding protein HflX